MGGGRGGCGWGARRGRDGRGERTGEAGEKPSRQPQKALSPLSETALSELRKKMKNGFYESEQLFRDQKPEAWAASALERPSEDGAGPREREAQGVAKGTGQGGHDARGLGRGWTPGARAGGPGLAWLGPGALSTPPQPLRSGLLSPPSLTDGTCNEAPSWWEARPGPGVPPPRPPCPGVLEVPGEPREALGPSGCLSEACPTLAPLLSCWEARSNPVT